MLIPSRPHQAIEAPALAVMVPLLIRGLREATPIQRKACVITTNMAKLVNSPLDAAHFLPALVPGGVGEALFCGRAVLGGVCAHAAVSAVPLPHKGLRGSACCCASSNIRTLFLHHCRGGPRAAHMRPACPLAFALAPPRVNPPNGAVDPKPIRSIQPQA
jgi:hypothetical protein